MADAKSLLKLLVECLGKKKLKTASAEIINEESFWSKMKFFVAFPKNFLLVQKKTFGFGLQIL